LLSVAQNPSATSSNTETSIDEAELVQLTFMYPWTLSASVIAAHVFASDPDADMTALPWQPCSAHPAMVHDAPVHETMTLPDPEMHTPLVDCCAFPVALVHDASVYCQAVTAEANSTVLQGFVLHVCEVDPAHMAPPPEGDGFEQVLVCVPAPHVAEQLLQLDHAPSIGDVVHEAETAELLVVAHAA